MVVVDATMLLLFFDPSASGPTNPDGSLVSRVRERIEYLIDELGRARQTIYIPAPALAETLIRQAPDKALKIVERINRASVFAIAEFDQRMAIELADIMRSDPLRSQRQAMLGGIETKAKLKFDRQIIATAKVLGSETIYSDDGGVKSLGERLGLHVVGVADLPIPPTDLQEEMFAGLEETNEKTPLINEQTPGA